MTADATAQVLVDAIVADTAPPAGSEVALLVNGLGATAQLDLYIVYRAARRALEARGIVVSRSFVGEYITSLEMAGASVTVTRLDEERGELLDAPARAIRFAR
jgi:dihydroxyacetone kinase